jgi:hypothetical protein
MKDLFREPTSSTKVRNGVYAYKYANGTINIDGFQYIGYSIKDAIKIYRSKKKCIN